MFWNLFTNQFIKNGGPVQLALLALSWLTLIAIIDQLIINFAVRRMSNNLKPNSFLDRFALLRLSLISPRDSDFSKETYLPENKVNRNVHFLVLVSNISPVLGVLGTVHGIILTFWEISGKQNVQFADISQGIAHALYTTAFGLCICVLSLLAIWWTERYIDEFEHLFAVSNDGDNK